MSLSRRSFLLASAAAAAEACGPLKEPECWTQASPGHDPPNELPVQLKAKAERCELFAFDEIAFERPTVYKPESHAELELLIKSVPPGRRVTFRGGGHSLDAQSLNSDIVIRTDHPCFAAIGSPQEDTDGFYMTVGAGARWWDILEKTSKLGLVPCSLVTAGEATAGGTLSADCLSRQSPIAGKEGSHVRSFKAMLAGGAHVELSRPGPHTSQRDKELWSGIIGGFGSLGVITEVTFDLVPARSNPNRMGETPKVLTRSTRHELTLDWDKVLRRLHQSSVDAKKLFDANNAAPRPPGTPPPSHVPLAQTPEWSAISIASFFVGSGMSANLLEQRFVEGMPLSPVPGGLYTVTADFPAIGERWISTVPTIIELGLDMGFPQGEFVDDLFGWAFFLGNSTKRAKQSLHHYHQRLNFIQQTFLLPSGDGKELDTRPTRRFIELIQARLHAVDMRPGAIDFLWVPGDDFLMSASRGLPGFVITVSFSDRNRDKLSTEIDECLRALTHDCRTLGGRVHLVKNVVADRADLRAMHGDAAKTLRELKRTYDPAGIFRNEFFDRVFDA